MKMPIKYRPELCCSNDPTQQILHNVMLKDDLIIATDGRRYIQIPVALEEGDVDGVIPSAVIAEARTQAEGSNELSVMSNGKLKFTSKFGPIEIENPASKVGKYPNTGQVTTRASNRKRHYIALNARLLMGIAEAIGSEEVTISFDNERSAITVEPKDSKKSVVHGILMPVI